MRRKKVVVASNGDTKAKITIEVDAPRHELAGYETERLMNILTSRSMENLATAPYLHASLAEVVLK